MKYKLIIFTFLLQTIFFSCTSYEDTSDAKDTISTSKNDTVKIKSIVDTTIVNLKNSDTLSSKINEKKEVKVFKYICPLGDKEGNSDKEGICPICEMELIENPDYTK